MGLFGSTDSNASAMGSNGASNGLAGMTPPTRQASIGQSSGLVGLDLLGGGTSYSSPPPPAAAKPASAPSQQQDYSAYDQNGLKITLTPNVNPARPEIVNIAAKFEATSGASIQSVNFQAAVPKVRQERECRVVFEALTISSSRQSQKLQMLAISNSTVTPGKAESQQMRVMAPKGAQIRLRLRVGFTVEGGEQVQDQVDFASFPSFS
jgi:AP-1 complex subunit gamma-1